MSYIKDLIANVEVGEVLSSGRLALFPLLARHPIDPDYLTLDEALGSGVARIGEIGEAGSVPELLFRNEGNRPVLLLDSEELVGAKQNRILNLSILAPAHAETKIPVSCVEAHRWGYRSRHFASSDRTFYARGRAAKLSQVSESLASTRSRRSDQHAIWENIAASSGRLGVRSETAAMADMFEQRRANIDEHVSRLLPQDRQVGAVFAIDGKVFGFDLFDAPASYEKLAPKLTRSYALEVLLGEDGFSDAVPPADVENLLKEVGEAHVTCFPAVGLGEDWRIKGDSIRGAALVSHGRVVHLCAFVA